MIAARLPAGSRKVRTPKSKMPGNTRGGVIYRIGPQKNTAQAASPATVALPVKVKWWGKSPPALVVIPRPGNPHLEQGQAEAMRLLVSFEPRVGC